MCPTRTGRKDGAVTGVGRVRVIGITTRSIDEHAGREDALDHYRPGAGSGGSLSTVQYSPSCRAATTKPSNSTGLRT